MGDTWKKIDYNKDAKTWMEPLIRGKTTGMVEIPANWDVSHMAYVAKLQLDDLPPLMFIKDSANSHGFVDAHVIEQKWKDHFEYLYQEERDGFIMPITLHPDVSGRPRKLDHGVHAKYRRLDDARAFHKLGE